MKAAGSSRVLIDGVRLIPSQTLLWSNAPCHSHFRFLRSSPRGFLDLEATLYLGSSGGPRRECQSRRLLLGAIIWVRRAVSAAQGVAKMAAQTIERNQAPGARQGQGGAISPAEATALARRLRMACARFEVRDGLDRRQGR